MVYLLPATIPPRRPKSPVLDVIHCVDALTLLKALPDNYVHCIVTSPPYWGLRDYQVDGQIGLEATLPEYIDNLVTIFREARRVLRDDGTFFLNLGDSYASGEIGRHDSVEGRRIDGKPIGKKFTERQQRKIRTGLKPKDLMMIPARVAIALQDDGWYLRQDNIWSKPNPMPESVKDRTTTAHEHVFHLTKSERYWYDADAIREAHIWADKDKRSKDGKKHKNKTGKTLSGQYKTNGTSYHPNGRNRRSVWEIATKPFSAAHFATFPEALAQICILAGCPKGGIVYDPFMGAGTTALVAQKLGRHYLGSELNPEYVDLANHRLQNRLDEHQAKVNGQPHTLHMFGESA